MKVRNILGVTTVAILSAVTNANAVNLQLLNYDATSGANFSFHHTAANSSGNTFYSETTPSAPGVDFYTTGPLTRTTSEGVGDPFGATTSGTASFLNFHGTMNLEDGQSITFNNGWLDFSSIDHSGDLMGQLPYTLYDGLDGAAGTGSVTDSGTYYAFDYNFGSAPNSPNSFVGDFSDGEIHLWMNNWDNSAQTRQEFINAGGVPQGVDLAIHVPDGGLSAILLGLSICGLGLFQRLAKGI